ncbi:MULTISPECIES: hypothetical protein [unclassified Moorena]|nr:MULTISPECIES: hypothetical protein [unclassified Moorena]
MAYGYATPKGFVEQASIVTQTSICGTGFDTLTERMLSSLFKS